MHTNKQQEIGVKTLSSAMFGVLISTYQACSQSATSLLHLVRNQLALLVG
jgi:hypothetical protein